MDIKEFINTFINEDPVKLRLRVNKDNFDFDTDFAITQIECRKKYAVKFNEYISNFDFIFTDSLSCEQASHQSVASFHAWLVGEKKNILDMTAGLGIDCLYLARKNNVKALEINPHKVKNLMRNADSLNMCYLQVINNDSIEFLKNNDEKYDIVFVDPARRDQEKRKVYNLSDCSPDIMANYDLISSHTDRILIKASPLLDVSQTLKDFPQLSAIRAIGVKGECKEILIDVINNTDSKEKGTVLLEAIDLDNSGNILSSFSNYVDRFSFEGFSYKMNYAYESDIKEGYYLLEPSAMMMKIAQWNSLAQKYKSLKLGKSTQLFVSKDFPAGFPGRVTRIIKFLHKKEWGELKGFASSVISRNHPLKAVELRKSLKLKEGDKFFIYATRIGEKPVMILTEVLEPIKQNV